MIITQAYWRSKNSEFIDWAAVRNAMVQAKKYGCATSTDIDAAKDGGVSTKRLGEIAACLDGVFNGAVGRHPDDQRPGGRVM
ncbi:TPA: hypothetical protein ACKP5P_000537 [Stenotrophomonas maltophilia]|uniref:hypothetical protein n=1 Tax=Stenotrophomonas sp. GD04024 TaxID=2975422 RepID=UPI002448B0B9|nr:hypothetical protein [Stenotrophomonas sp. GD04024]MDG9988327.1 hypothetical protein [Stenotrophomonas sp. GD04024]